MNGRVIEYAIWGMLSVFLSSGKVQNTGGAGIEFKAQTKHQQTYGAPYPRLPESDFTGTWKGEESCIEKDSIQVVLIITAKDSFSLNISGIYKASTKIEGKIRGYSISIERQKTKAGGVEEGRLVISNDRKKLRSNLNFFTKEGKETCTGVFSR